MQRVVPSALSRRTFLYTLAALASPLDSFAATDDFQELEELPPVPEEYASLAGEPPMNKEFGDRITNLGTSPPSPEQNKIASDIISAAPKHVSAIEVARFFLNVGRGTYGEAWRPYTRAWPRDAPANPLILEFFNRIKSKPQGDTTAWCAAFMNWCLIQATDAKIPAGASKPTMSASSSSFRKWGHTILEYNSQTNQLEGGEDPKVGDVAVFQLLDNGQPDRFHGHVAFFLDLDANRIRVIGGNQFEGNPVVHAINVKWMPLNGSLQLHSIRRDKLLDGA